MDDDRSNLLTRIERLNAIGVALSAEQDTARLLEMILLGAKEITGADGGTLYTVTEDEQLRFEIIHTDSLGIAMGGTTGNTIPFAALPIYNEDGQPNDHMVAAYCVHHRQTVNIPDAYQAEGFDFSGTRAFDRETGYRSRSFLTIPLQNHRNEVIGALQLINKCHGTPVNNCHGIDAQAQAFSAEDQQLAESLASQAAVALTNKALIEELQQLFESFIKLMAGTIDEKSPYTGGHCKRVPVLTLLLADAAAADEQGPMKDFTLSKDERYALEVAAWLHDCGKVATPEHVVDKATKLETIVDRIHLVEARLEILRRDAEITCLQQSLAAARAGNGDMAIQYELERQRVLVELDERQAFLHACNVGGEFMTEAARERVRNFGKTPWRSAAGELRPLLTEDEIDNLTIPRGTLNNKERAVINRHIDVTIKMLESLPFPRHLRQVPEYAGGHHERMDGTGYPKGLTREQMSVPARIMAIADVFEALTAKDRPYKKAKPLSEALAIMGRMKQGAHIDPDLFEVFLRQKVYRRYAEQFLEPEQLDVMEPEDIPGYPFL